MRVAVAIPVMWLTFAVAFAQAPDAPPPSVVSEARALIGEGRLDEAAAKLRAHLAGAPDDGAAWNALGAALNRSERYEEALAAADRAVALMPENFGARFNRGLVLWEHGRFAGSVEDISAALAVQPDLVAGYAERGSALMALGRLDAARADWDRAEALDPDYVWVDYYRGLLDVAEGGFASGARRLDRVTAAQPEHAGARLWRWVAHRRAGAAAPDLPDETAWPGPVAAYLEGRHDAAELEQEAQRQALTIDQRRLASALFFVGQKRLVEGDRAGAEGALRRALALGTPRFAEMLAAEMELERLTVLP